MTFNDLEEVLRSEDLTIHKLLNELHQLALSGEGNPKQNIVDYLIEKYNKGNKSMH